MSANSDVKIIVAGLPRTSTTSLKKGLEILGVTPCFHLGDPPAPISRVKESARVLAIQDRNERLKALKKLYDGFEAVFEPPASALVDDMLTIYPNAKVILSVRKNPQVWLASYYGLGIDLRSKWYRILGYWIPGVIHSSDLIVAWSKYYSEKFGLDEVPSEELYHKHNQWVHDIVPAGQLLEYQPSMGWEPLARFLDRPVPEGEPFPRVNEAAFLRNVKRVAMGLGSLVWLCLFVGLYYAGSFAWSKFASET
ncbi:uncharacterized protein BKA55DRAFT_643235 [Fusarium redolens]|uniref:NAD dependent epimerase/dehydratase n=1 Tax=Fusarium redolens TaxID=48865 RepID=A0A9P9KEB4_FUSRE|nr:uncharacterized protein BKA55DRAFT_643235 [Fusarium redolens]KAH7254216.1 hypothetical protein BKA55DRAFT_643235 [Fusarium redolens]